MDEKQTNIGPTVIVNTEDGPRELTKHELTLMYLPPKRNHNRRRKKVVGPNCLVSETVPLNDVRRTYPAVFASLTSRASLDEIRTQFSKIVAGEDFTFVITTLEGENPFGPVYRENKGLEASIRFLAAYFQAVPDCIVTHSNMKFYKRKNGESILKTNFTITGCMAFKVLVNNAEQVDDFKCAVQGLQVLQSAFQPTSEHDDSIESAEESDDYEDDEDESVEKVQTTFDDDCDNNDNSRANKRARLNDDAIPDCSSSESLHSSMHTKSIVTDASSKIDAGLILRQKMEERDILSRKKKVAVGDTEVLIDADDDEDVYRNMLITSESTSYQLGQRTEGRTFSTGGKMIFYMNKDKKLVKIDAQYSAKKTLESCKYDSLNDIPNGSNDLHESDSPPTLAFTAAETISDVENDEDNESNAES